jgi:hypothetical protein
MKWLYITVGLLATSVCLVGWIYLRDRDTSSYLPPGPTERQLADIDATATLNQLAGADCRPDCTAKLLARTTAEHWLIRITVKGHPRCLQINLYTFRISPQHGLTGVQPSHCPTRAQPPTPVQRLTDGP